MWEREQTQSWSFWGRTWRGERRAKRRRRRALKGGFLGREAFDVWARRRWLGRFGAWARPPCHPRIREPYTPSRSTSLSVLSPPPATTSLRLSLHLLLPLPLRKKQLLTFSMCASLSLPLRFRLQEKLPILYSDSYFVLIFIFLELNLEPNPNIDNFFNFTTYKDSYPVLLLNYTIIVNLTLK